MWFGKRKSEPQEQPAYAAAMQAALENAQKTDPLVRAKIGSRALKDKLYNVLKSSDPRGVHAETALGMLGSLAGFSCVLYALSAQRAGHGKDDPGALMVVTGADGKNYIYGNLTNGPLLENEHSVWSLVAGIAQHLGSSQIPDVSEIAKHVASTAGGELFGIPRIPEGHKLADTPRGYVRALWPVVINEVKNYTTDPAEWPILFALAAQQVMQDAQQVLEPGLAAKIVMECAIPMSKIDPDLAFD